MKKEHVKDEMFFPFTSIQQKHGSSSRALRKIWLNQHIKNHQVYTRWEVLSSDLFVFTISTVAVPPSRILPPAAAAAVFAGCHEYPCENTGVL